MSIVISPRVGAVDEDAVITTVLQNLKSSHDLGGELMTEQWRQGHTLRVIRREPYQTRTLKVLPLHVIHSTRAEPAREESMV